jgi:acyl carrier protein
LTNSDIEERLSEYIRNNVLKRPGYLLGSDDPLISSGLIDSFHLIDLALFIEELYNVRIDDTELNAATFDSLAQLAELIHQRLKL